MQRCTNFLWYCPKNSPTATTSSFAGSKPGNLNGLSSKDNFSSEMNEAWISRHASMNMAAVSGWWASRIAVSASWMAPAATYRISALKNSYIIIVWQLFQPKIRVLSNYWANSVHIAIGTCGPMCWLLTDFWGLFLVKLMGLCNLLDSSIFLLSFG